MSRREFPKSVRVEIVRRATVASVVRCEECGCAPRTWHVDHTIPDALFLDKKRPLTAADGKVLCAGSPDTCHGRKTPQDVADIAKAKRREAKHCHVDKSKPTPLTGRSRAEINRDHEARRAARGHGKSMPPRRMLPGFVSAAPTDTRPS